MVKGSQQFQVMEAKSVGAIPSGKNWQYEPKWDGFRCLLERDGATLKMSSKSGQDLARYFPEIVQSAMSIKRKKFLLDGELVIPSGKAFSFDRLLQRIHPAQSRIVRLAKETPAIFIAFDILRDGNENLAELNLADRKPKLEKFAHHFFGAGSFFRHSSTSQDLSVAKKWLEAAGGGSDGIIAKRLDLPYQAGNREGMQKIKRYRTADCVVGGFRYAQTKQSKNKVVGSLLLGLYDDGGLLHHVGFTSALKSEEKADLSKKLEAISAKQSFTGNAPGGPSRWSTKRSDEWHAVKPRFVIEISYDHFTGNRFRHGTSITRWRTDKSPRQCTMDQLQQKFISPQKLLEPAVCNVEAHHAQSCDLRSGRHTH